MVKTLEGILPSCASCKRIRTEDGESGHIEKYVSEHPGRRSVMACVQGVRKHSILNTSEASTGKLSPTSAILAV
jgi:hypothetical protein